MEKRDFFDSWNLVIGFGYALYTLLIVSICAICIPMEAYENLKQKARNS